MSLSTLTLDLPTARAFVPLLAPARYKGAWGGRGSGKSHFFAELMVEDALSQRGLRCVCIREVQKDLKDSAKLLIEDKIVRLGVASQFDVQRDLIVTPGGGQIIFRGMQDYNSESIKSLEGFDRAWLEEAHTISARSLSLLRPTIRKDGSQIWASWNPNRRTDPVDALLRGPTPPPDTIVVRANWSDNPWLPRELEAERAYDEAFKPDQYDHVWEGGYARVTEGAYYAQSLVVARREGRIGKVAQDPLMRVLTFWDIGGSGTRADATAIWVAQFIDREVRVLAYYEAQGQPLGAHLEWLRSKGYGKALCVLPHDGAAAERVVSGTYAGHVKAAQFDVVTVPNQGAGAALRRIEAGRRLFPSIWFNEETTKGGLDALGAYHERKDEKRGIGLGPLHNWASHAADSFGMMCLAYEAPDARDREDEDERPRGRNAVTGY